MKEKPPCFDEQTRTDCPRRAVGCREGCEAWKAYRAAHEVEKQKEARDKAAYYEARDFAEGLDGRNRSEASRRYMKKRSGTRPVKGDTK